MKTSEPREMMKRIDFSGNGDYNKALSEVANRCSCC